MVSPQDLKKVSILTLIWCRPSSWPMGIFRDWRCASHVIRSLRHATHTVVDAFSGVHISSSSVGVLYLGAYFI